VVGFPHEIKGQGIFAYVILGAINNGATPSELVGALKEQVRHVIGPIATPDRIMIVPGLPKTRSGKIMRRILRNIAAGEYTDLGDITTLADPSVVEKLIEGHKELGG
jgi:acetyl-CoA synthetase